jgi:predicted amidohydrolase
MMMLTKIGFFHYGREERTQPLRSLRISLKAAGKDYVKDSLIVLPEAFNIKTKYQKGTGPHDTDPKIKDDLQKLAADFELTFVAGLIIREAGERTRPYNSAYLISPDSCPLLSRKMETDTTGDKIYERCTKACDAPVRYEQTSLAALICIDATSGRQRHQELRTRIAQLGTGCPILCVPAYTQYLDTPGIAADWSDMHFILANGCPLPHRTQSMAGYHPSVIRIKGRDQLTFQGRENKVIVSPLPGIQCSPESAAS